MTWYRIVAKYASGCVVSLPRPSLEDARMLASRMINGDSESVIEEAGVWSPEPLGDLEWLEIQGRVQPVSEPPDRYHEGRAQGLSPAEAEARAAAYDYVDGLAGRLGRRVVGC